MCLTRTIDRGKVFPSTKQLVVAGAKSPAGLLPCKPSTSVLTRRYAFFSPSLLWSGDFRQPSGWSLLGAIVVTCYRSITSGLLPVGGRYKTTAEVIIMPSNIPISYVDAQNDIDRLTNQLTALLICMNADDIDSLPVKHLCELLALSVELVFQIKQLNQTQWVAIEEVLSE